MSDIVRERTDGWRFSECGGFASRDGMIYVIDGSEIRLTEYPGNRLMIAIKPGCDEPNCRHDHLGLAYVFDKGDIKDLIGAIKEITDDSTAASARKIMH